MIPNVSALKGRNIAEVGIFFWLCTHLDDNNQCWPSLEKLTEETGLSKKPLIKHLNSLEKSGLITKIKQRDSLGYQKVTLYQINILTNFKCLSVESPPCVIEKPKEIRGNQQVIQSRETPLRDSPRVEFLPSLSGDLTHPRVENLHPNYIHKNYIHKNYKKEIYKEKEIIDPVMKNVIEIFDYWKLIMNHPNTKLDHTRIIYIKRNLIDYTVEQLKVAIDGCKLSEWHMGKNNNGQMFNAIKDIFKNNDTIDKFIDIYQYKGEIDERKQQFNQQHTYKSKQQLDAEKGDAVANRLKEILIKRRARGEC